mgnify:CR=1 FL=1
MVKLHIAMRGGQSISLVALVKGTDHFHSKRLSTVRHLLVAGELLKNSLDARCKLVGSRIVATWINLVGTELGDKTCRCQDIELNCACSNPAAEDSIAVAQVNSIAGKGPWQTSKDLPSKTGLSCQPKQQAKYRK